MAGEGSSSSAVAMVGVYTAGNVMKKARVQSVLSALLHDPILSDVPRNPSLSDVDAPINLVLVSAMKFTLLKVIGGYVCIQEGELCLDVAVLNTTTVKDLKLAIQRKINEIEQSQMGHRHISWRHVWKNFCLAYHNEKLIDDKSILHDFRVRNNSQVRFLPCVVSRLHRRHSRRRKQRFFHGLNQR